MEKSWKEIDAETDSHFQKQMEEGKRRSSADHDFFDAAQRARAQVTSDELLPARTETGELKYRVSQGLKAACHTREDVIALTYIQRSQLVRLSRIQTLLYACVGLLLYIAFRVT